MDCKSVLMHGKSVLLHALHAHACARAAAVAVIRASESQPAAGVTPASGQIRSACWVYK